MFSIYSPMGRNFSSSSKPQKMETETSSHDTESTSEFDPDLERIVDDVDSMYREHLRLLHPPPPDIKSDLIDSLTR